MGEVVTQITDEYEVQRLVRLDPTTYPFEATAWRDIQMGRGDTCTRFCLEDARLSKSRILGDGEKGRIVHTHRVVITETTVYDDDTKEITGG